MTINPNEQTNFLYHFQASGAVYPFTNIAQGQSYNGDDYLPVTITHRPPTYSSRGEDAEVDITIHEAVELGDLFLNGPPAYPVTVNIYEYDRLTNTATPYYRGWVVRVPFKLTDSLVELHCKSVWHFFDRESLGSSLSVLSRYSIYDPRAGVDLSALRTGITVTALNDERDALTVTGITQIDTYFRGGMIVAPDQDKRTVVEHVGGTITLNAAFPEFTLAAGFSADLYPGDDLLYSTWANKFAAETNNGEQWGGWQYTPNADPAVKGVF